MSTGLPQIKPRVNHRRKGAPQHIAQERRSGQVGAHQENLILDYLGKAVRDHFSATAVQP
jgi:hypothetical protein